MKLYFKIVGFLFISIIILGIVAPALISYRDDYMVLMGVGLIVVCYIPGTCIFIKHLIKGKDIEKI